MNDEVSGVRKTQATDDHQHNLDSGFAVCSSPNHQEPRAHDEESHQGRWHARTDKRFIVECLTLAAIIFGGLVYWGQLNEMKLSNDWAVTSTMIGDQRTIASLRLAQESNLLTARNIELSSRAWLLLVHISREEADRPGNSIAFRPNVKIDFPVPVQNTGKSPAQRVWGTWGSAVVTVGAPSAVLLAHIERNIANDIPSEPEAGVIAPGDKFFVLVPVKIGQDGLDAVKSGASRIMIYGVILYSDPFSHQRRTRFCRYLGAPGSGYASPCPIHNSAE